MSLEKPYVLLVTHSGDYFTVDRVAEGLVRRGAIPIRFDTDRFPMNVRLGLRMDRGPFEQTLVINDQTIRGEDIRAVWQRRLVRPVLPDNLDPTWVAACAQESHAVLKGFLDQLQHARWFDPLPNILAAEDKFRQLAAAIRHGFSVPRTLVTNNPDEVRAFFEDLKGNVVTKLLTALSFSMDGRAAAMHTSLMRRDHLDKLDSLRFCPMVFQEHISKAFELRIAYVGGRCFAGAIDASKSANGHVDWRKSGPDECPFRKVDVPDELAARIDSLMKDLGLGFGALDVIRTPEGEYVFLEVNPVGEWGMLERDLDLPIADAIAEELLR
jgi:MvdC family ATP-grasp ribosomal peptide maturase